MGPLELRASVSNDDHGGTYIVILGGEKPGSNTPAIGSFYKEGQNQEACAHDISGKCG